MKHIKRKLAAAALLAFGTWRGAVELRPHPMTELFNRGSGAAGTVPEYRLPSLVMPQDTKGLWRIRVGSWEMAHSGHHTFLEFGPVDEKPGDRTRGGNVFQIQGIAENAATHDHASLDFGKFESYKNYAEGDYVLKALGVIEDFNKDFFNKQPDCYVDVFYGTKDEVLKMYMDAMQEAAQINRQSVSYKLIDQNSNSVQRTLLEALGLNVPDIYSPHLLMTDSARIWTPGLEYSILQPGWDRQKARDQGGYANLSGDELESAARKISRGAKAVWDNEKPAHNFRPAGPGSS
jgi:hypothetical protein